MDHKNRAFAQFLSDENTNYIRAELGIGLNSELERLSNAMTTFLQTHIALVDNYTGLWENVRTLNRVFIEEYTPNPVITNSYSSFGEAEFLNNQVHYGDLYNIEEGVMKANGTYQPPRSFLFMPDDLSKETKYQYIPHPRRTPWNS
jgi:hypothetical protein